MKSTRPNSLMNGKWGDRFLGTDFQREDLTENYLESVIVAWTIGLVENFQILPFDLYVVSSKLIQNFFPDLHLLSFRKDPDFVVVL